MRIPGIPENELGVALENQCVKDCIKYGVGEGIAVSWLHKHGEAYLNEKLSIVRDYQKRGTITSTEAKLLIAAVNEDYKDASPQKQLDEKKKILRDAARIKQQKEWEDSEKQIEEQRKAREAARAAVSDFVQKLPHAELVEMQSAFTAETTMNHSDTEAFHDWIAEQQKL